MMNLNKMSSERILSHILEILSLLTGKVSVLKHLTKSLTVIEMDQDKEVSEMILSHTLEIIYLVTGEEYTILKKKSPRIHHPTGECDPNGHKESLAISSNRSSGLQSDNVDPVSEEGVDEKNTLPVPIQSELSADSDKVTPSGLSESDQEETNIRRPREMKEEEIPVIISDGPQDGDLYPELINEDGEYESDAESSHQMGIHLDHRTDVAMTSNMIEEHQTSLLSPDRVRDDFSVSQGYTDANQSCVKQQTGETSVVYSDGGKVFTRNANLIRLKGVHTGANPHTEQSYMCSECGECFSEASRLNRHKKTHTRDRSFACSDCGKCFSHASTLNNHKRTHTGERPYACSECGKCFSQSSYLSAHKKTHTGEKPFSCSECGKSFSRALSLTDHKRTHTGERPFACSECGKCFSQASTLNHHKRTHTEEKPYSCAECGKCFSQISALNHHKKNHTGAKPFSCTECGKSFSQASHLNVHMRTHTGERPYSCSECGKCFSTTSNLTAHSKTHTGGTNMFMF